MQSALNLSQPCRAVTMLGSSRPPMLVHKARRSACEGVQATLVVSDLATTTGGGARRNLC